MRRKLGLWLTWVTIVVLITSYISPWFKPNQGFSLSLVGLLFPFVHITGWILLGLTNGHKQKSWFLLLLLQIIMLPSIRHFVNMTISSSDGGHVVMSYNAMTGIKMVDDRYVMTSEIKKQFSSMIEQSPQPDVILLQEVNHVVEKILPSKAVYPYYHKLKRRGTAILSKYPIITEGVIDFGARPNSCVWADIDMNGEMIRYYSTHLESNRLNEETVKMITDKEHDRGNVLSSVKHMISNYQKYAYIRANQAEKIKEHMAKSPYPVIVGGDFNETPMSYAYETLAEDMTDAFIDKGKGSGNTWIGLIPLLRIDYILADNDVEIQSFFKMKSYLSDHYPIKATFDLK